MIPISTATASDLPRFAEITQITDASYCNTSLLYYDEPTKAFKRIISYMREHIGRGQRYAILCTKQSRPIIEKAFPKATAIVHYNAERGMDKLKDIPLFFLVGYQGQPTDKMRPEIERTFALTGKECLSLEYDMTRFTPLESADKFMQAYVNMYIRGGILQALGRARIYEPKKWKQQVYVLTNIDIGINPDHIEQLKQPKFMQSVVRTQIEANRLLIEKTSFTIADILPRVPSSEKSVRRDLKVLVKEEQIKRTAGPKNLSIYTKP